MCCGVVRILFGWVFEGSIYTCACFPLEKFFVPCCCCFFLRIVFRNGKREERWEREDAHLVKYESIQLEKLQRTKNYHKFKSFQVKL